MNGNFQVNQYEETIGAAKAVTVRLLKFFALVAGVGLKLRIPGGSNVIDLPINFVFGENDGADIGNAEVFNPTGGAVDFKLLTSSRSFIASGNTSNVTIAAVATNFPVKGIDADGVASTAAPVQVAGNDGALVQTLKTDTTGRLETVSAETRTTERAAVADGIAARLVVDSIGRLVTAPHAPTSLRLSAFVTIAAIGVVDLIAAQAAGVRIYLASLTIGNDGGGDNVAIILDGAVELFRVPVKAGDTVQLLFPIPEQGSAATALRVNVTVATSMRVHAIGHKGI